MLPARRKGHDMVSARSVWPSFVIPDDGLAADLTDAPVSVKEHAKGNALDVRRAEPCASNLCLLLMLLWVLLHVFDRIRDPLLAVLVVLQGLVQPDLFDVSRRICLLIVQFSISIGEVIG